MSTRTKETYITPTGHSGFRLKVQYNEDEIQEKEVLSLLDEMKNDADAFFALAKHRKTRWKSGYGYWYTICRISDTTLTITE